MPLVQPPCAYRLSLDSGVEFNNVSMRSNNPWQCAWTRGCACSEVWASAWSPPLAARTSGPTTLGRARADRRSAEDSAPQLAPCRQSSLQDCRRVRNLSMAALAHQIGVSIDTVTSVDGAAVCCATSRECASSSACVFSSRFRDGSFGRRAVAAHAERYLLAPSQFPLRRPTRKFEAAAATRCRAVARDRRAKCARTTLESVGRYGSTTRRPAGAAPRAPDPRCIPSAARPRAHPARSGAAPRSSR